MSKRKKNSIGINKNFIVAENTLFFVSVVQSYFSIAYDPKSGDFIPYLLSVLFIVAFIIVKLAYSAFLLLETERIDTLNPEEREDITDENRVAQKAYLIVTAVYMNVYTLLLIFLSFQPQFTYNARIIVTLIPIAYCLYIIKFKKQFPRVYYKYKKLFIKGMNSPFIFVYAYLVCSVNLTVLSLLFFAIVYLYLITMPFLIQKIIMWEQR